MDISSWELTFSELWELEILNGGLSSFRVLGKVLRLGLDTLDEALRAEGTGLVGDVRGDLELVRGGGGGGTLLVRRLELRSGTGGLASPEG